MRARARSAQTGTRVWRVETRIDSAAASGKAEVLSGQSDQLATEEPLEIRLRWASGGEATGATVAVTMRTPGAAPGSDAELAAGFLHGEGIVERREQILGLAEPEPNVVEVELAGRPADLPSLERHFFTSSACGVCGKAGLEALRVRIPRDLSCGPVVEAQVLSSLPGKLRAAQRVFDSTGGLHAAGLFDAEGRLLAAREDVGRHNAVDKLLGWAFLAGLLPLREHIVTVSGRSSYEILQKCLAARVPVVCAVSAPSSLAVELAERFGVTLVGFLRGARFNVYSGIERIELSEGAAAGRRPRRSALPVVV